MEQFYQGSILNSICRSLIIQFCYYSPMVLPPCITGSAKYEGFESKGEELHSGQVGPVQKWKFCAGQSNATL